MASYIDSANTYRRRIGELLAAYENLIGINEEYVALDVGNNVSDPDFSDITAAEFVAGVGAAQAVIAAVAANDTNLYRASDGSQR